jgi:carbonic anhydrase
MIPTPEQALERLLAGNERFAAGRARRPRQDAARRAEVCGGQLPFAVVLGCADSRVPPEIVFDQGLGDLFVLRVAGNVIDDVLLGTIELAVTHLHTPLVMVLGHSQCGAVTAVVAEDELAGHLPDVARAIQPAVDAAGEMDGDLLANAVRVNAERTALRLRESRPILAPLVEAGSLSIVAAQYDLDRGTVKLIPSRE